MKTMEQQDEKCVMIIEEALPLGLVANTAAILGITLGRQRPDVVGVDVADQSGRCHRGIIEFPVPVLKASPDVLKTVRDRLYEPEFRDLSVVDFSDLAQSCKTYGEFVRRMAQTQAGALRYFGIAICGPKKKVNRLTGSMPLLR